MMNSNSNWKEIIEDTQALVTQGQDELKLIESTQDEIINNLNEMLELMQEIMELHNKN